jgi:hypothetical protein
MVGEDAGEVPTLWTEGNGMMHMETHPEEISASQRSLAPHKALGYARFGGVFSTDRKAPNQSVRSNCNFQIGQNVHFYWLVISVQRGDSPQILQFLAVLGSGFPPLYIDTSHNDVGGDAHFM